MTGQTRRLREEARTEVQGYLFNVSQPASESTGTQHVRQYVFLAHESGLRQGRWLRLPRRLDASCVSLPAIEIRPENPLNLARREWVT